MSNRRVAIKIIRELHGQGFEALLAGGCVRDMLLGRRPKDYDVATSARPEDVMRIFRRTLKVGAQFGVVIVLDNSEQVEVATFRTESGYVDGRHPGEVHFSDAEEDAKRRDFTVNAMFQDPIKDEVIDYVGGQADLTKRIIKTVGEPMERFGEDYLRMLRAVRFSTQLGFEIEDKTWAAICALSGKIEQISAERITVELEGVLGNPRRAEGVRKLFASGLGGVIFDGFGESEQDSALGVLGELSERIDFPLGLAALLAGFTTEDGMEQLKRLRLSRNQVRHVKFLLENRGVLLEDDMPISRLRMLASEPYWLDLCAYQKAIQKSRGETAIFLQSVKRRLKELGDIELRPKPLLNGHELMGLGCESGPVLGQLAEELYIAQLEGEVRNREAAAEWSREWLRRHKDSLL